MNLTNIASAVETVCRNSAPEPIYGSTLASKVGKLLGVPVHFSAAYGSLKIFVETHCRNKVSWCGKKGGNDLFLFIAQSTQDRPQNFWRTFSSPNSSAKLFVHLKAGTLKLTSSDAAPPEGCREIQKLSNEEQLKYVKHFLERLSIQDKHFLSPILERPNYWFKWTQSMMNYDKCRYSNEWKDYRLTSVVEIFHERLKQMALPDDLVSYAVTQLRGLPYNAPPSPEKAPSRPLPDVENVQLRQVILKAIHLLNEEDLRSLKFPAGVLLDAFKSL
jgi:hypothetical protein